MNPFADPDAPSTVEFLGERRMKQLVLDSRSCENLQFFLSFRLLDFSFDWQSFYFLGWFGGVSATTIPTTFRALLKRWVISGSLVGLLVIFRDVSFALVYCSPVGLQSSKTLMMVILGQKRNPSCQWSCHDLGKSVNIFTFWRNAYTRTS